MTQSPKKAELYRMVMHDHVCPYGIKSKDLLKRNGFEVKDHHLKTRAETDAFKEKHGVETTPQTFIDGKRIGGYNDLREYFGLARKDQNKTTYQPVIAIFAVTFLLALAVSWMAYDTFAGLTIFKLFIAFSMCVLGILKLRDLYAFSNQFVTYDLLARRYVPYAYIYPFIETGAGILMIAGFFVLPAALGALFIGTIGAVSVFKAVYLEKRELKCACVGGNSNVPLGFISLTENLMMIAMALAMLGDRLL